jgi:hypothetical protein
MSATVETAYVAKRREVSRLLDRLAILIGQNDATNRNTRNWGDVGDMERVLGAVQIAVDVLRVNPPAHCHQHPVPYPGCPNCPVSA